MEKEWLQYLSNIFPSNEIESCIIYTDSNSYWLAKGLADACRIRKIKVSMSLMNRVSSEEAHEIRQSFPLQNSRTLLAAIFSEFNPSIDSLNLLFPPLQGPMNFSGLSFVTLQHFPKQYFSSFLVSDYSATRDLRTKYLNKLVSGSEIKITSVAGTDISFKLHSEVISYPFQLDKNHVLFPSTEIVMQLEPNSLNGRIVIDKSIGEFIESGELLDPFGKVINNIELYLNDGEIDRIISSDRIGNRLESVLNSLQSGEKKFSKFGIGIGPSIAHTGFVEVDKLLDGLCSFGTSINSLELICSFDALDIL